MCQFKKKGRGRDRGCVVSDGSETTPFSSSCRCIAFECSNLPQNQNTTPKLCVSMRFSASVPPLPRFTFLLSTGKTELEPTEKRTINHPISGIFFEFSCKKSIKGSVISWMCIQSQTHIDTIETNK